MTLDDLEFHMLEAYPVYLCIALWLIQSSMTKQNTSSLILFWQLLCTRMADKVLPDNFDSSQASISGCLGILCLVLPLLVILYLVQSFAHYAWLFDGLLLYVAVDFAANKQRAFACVAALSEEKNALAKSRLQKNTLRQTNNLSQLGLIKANLESFALRMNYQWFTVISIYLSLGVLPALSYRLFYEAAQISNVKQRKFSQYGKFSYMITQVFQYLPVKIHNLLLLLTGVFHNPKASIQLMFSAVFWQFGGASILASASGVLNVKLGGPVMREGSKFARSRFVGKREPSLRDLQRLAMRYHIVTLCLLMLSYALYLYE